MAEYTPTEARVCIDFCNAATTRKGPSGDTLTMEEADQAFDRFIARVRRDAEREAMRALRTHLAASRGHQLIGPDGLDYYIHNHHPEETP